MRSLPSASRPLANSSTLHFFLAAFLCALILATFGFAANDRISKPIVAQQGVRLAAGMPMQARPEFDRGAVDPSLKLGYMTLLSAPKPAQKRALDKLLANQQNPRSPLYHKWLTPEQYAERFGLSPADLNRLKAWLQSQGFTIVRTARARNWIAFSGTAAQAEKAFQVQIHNFEVKGETHFANTTPITIPAALSGVVTGVRGLNNFRPKPQARQIKRNYTFPFGGKTFLFVAPGDVATMYDINTLYQSGIDGTGQKVAVIGQTGVFQSDLTNFRTSFGLSPINCTTNGSGIITACNTSNFRYILVNGSATNIFSDIVEADIDIEWAGAAARNAQIMFYTATDPNQGGVFDSLVAAIDDNLAPVITMSYTTPCELAEIGFFDSDEAVLAQANAQGQTFMNSSGDTGAAECDFGANIAEFGLAVAYPASSQYVTGVGGTSIPQINPNEYDNTFWGNTNGGDGGSALSYIPEQNWNDSQEFGLICTANPSDGFCTFFGVTDWESVQVDAIGISAGGGGVSNCATADANGVCNGGFPQPAWQSGLSAAAVNPGGVGEIDPNTPTRYTPDVSLLGSPNFPGYLVCTQAAALGGGSGSTCASGISGMLNACLAGTAPCSIFGGTSVSSPVFAGIVSLLNQNAVASGLQTVPGLGNINPMLYSLAADSTNGAFNPVTTANTGAFSNGAWCDPGQPVSGIPSDPWPAALQCPSTGQNLIGFSTFNFDPTTKYNLVTGLGSVNASHLADAMVAAAKASTTTDLQTSGNPSNFGDQVTFTATVTTTGTVTPTGAVTFLDGQTQLGTAQLGGALGGVVNFATATFSTITLSSGSHQITASYAGDTNNLGSTSNVVDQVVNAPTFTVSTATAPGTVLAGIPASSTFTVTPTSAGTFQGAVTFACQVPDTTMSCSFSPASIAAGLAATQVTWTINTSGPNTPTNVRNRKHRADNRFPLLPLTLPLAGVVMLGFAGRKRSRYSAFAGLSVALVLFGLLLACGSSSPPVNVALSPAGATVFANYAPDGWPPQTATFTPTVTNTSNTAVTYSLSSSVSCSANPSPCGSMSGNTYTAPTVAAGLPATVTVTATSQADTTKSASSTITLTPTTVPTAIVGAPYSIGLSVTENGQASAQTQAVSLTVQ